MAEPPWLLRGEGLLALVPRPGSHAHRLPSGLHGVPGPASVVAMTYDDTPVGPYRELSVAVPARLGLRPVMCTVAMVVSSPAARLACRERWGLPAELGELRWSSSPGERRMEWAEGSVELSGRPRGPRLTLVLPLRWGQGRPGGPVVLPRRLRARARLAHCVVDVAHDHELAWIAGRHPGLAFQGARIVASPARRPAGMLSSIPWRERVLPGASEPAGGAAATMTSPRAYGSVG